MTDAIITLGIDSNAYMGTTLRRCMVKRPKVIQAAREMNESGRSIKAVVKEGNTGPEIEVRSKRYGIMPFICTEIAYELSMNIQVKDDKLILF